MNKLQQLWTDATTDGVPYCSLKVSLVVGTILNAINQGDYIFTGDGMNYWKLALTYLVPFCVATYGAVMAKQRLRLSSQV